ncbi:MULTISPECIES: serine/threonine-protein kinase [unclassified Thalassospira]|uniref:serine/threonine-protein kinase n=1 Tax=unclassified Thalassospira TaxID=2648997 RepID=UPI0007A57AC4|nr:MULTISPECIES: serine/threonine-protein kinase [unclassified Thalassospira]KZC99431.1 hypothetical protein AUQ41_13140 [Thalassospira sp. MCCC 1A02898]ONH85548.1 serine/threonine protein kinase [Thalassospira sp. MCCC 1A02803]
MNFKSNLVLGDYLGSGHFGAVYKCQDELHGEVAAKIMSQKRDETEEEWELRKKALLSEAQNLKKATDHNVVPVHYIVYKDKQEVTVDGEQLDQVSTETPDGNSLADSVLFVMKLCEGGSLQEVYEFGPSNIEFTRKVATEITLGLQALHARGMIHRDIKPGNILIDDDGSAKLADFGLVTDELIYGYADRAGYWDHLAYELFKGSGTSVKTDIWALGMTLYRLLHGEKWYTALPRPAVSVPKGGFSNTLTWLPHVPQRWRRVIKKMLNDDPDSRYQSTHQVLHAFADLPTSPCFNCTVEDNFISWERKANSRIIEVTWEQISSRKHHWTAVSKPANGQGRLRTLGGSEGVVCKTQALSGLQEFFRAQK